MLLFFFVVVFCLLLFLFVVLVCCCFLFLLLLFFVFCFLLFFFRFFFCFFFFVFVFFLFLFFGGRARSYYKTIHKNPHSLLARLRAIAHDEKGGGVGSKLQIPRKLASTFKGSFPPSQIQSS